MADPFTEATNELVPVRANTNFFDPTPGASIMARYAASGRAMKDLDELNQLESSSLRNRFERRRLADYDVDKAFEDRRRERQQIEWDRDDLDHQDKLAAREARGGLLRELGQLDPEADDYDSKINEIVSRMPAGVMEDDAVRSIIAFNNGIANRTLQARNQANAIQQRHDNALRLFRERKASDAGFEGISDEEFASTINPNTGEPDAFALARLAGRARRGNESSEFDRRQEVQQENAKERIQLQGDISLRNRTAAQKASGGVSPAKARADEEKRILNHLVDDEAFPTQLWALRNENPGKSDKLLEQDEPEKFRAAKAWDSKQKANELESARGNTMEAYVNKVQFGSDGKAPSDKVKEKRRAFWRLANGEGQAEITEEVSGGEDPTVTTTVKVEDKPLTREGAQAFLQQAKGDREEARRLAREAGYTKF